jgi:DNA helicase-2/ATP-dependent DNA helicase PcrA
MSFTIGAAADEGRATGVPPAPSSPAMPLLAGLNPEQLAAVTLPPEHALILAGAGSGKTRVLTTRIAWLLQTGQISPGGVLAVTFTNKAAKEMLARLSAMLPLSVRGMWIGTFHGLCHRMLRAHWRLTGLPQSFQILDMQDQLSAIKRLYRQFNLDEDDFPPKQIQYFIAGCKEDALRPDAVPVRQGDEHDRRRVEIYRLYEAQCQREGVVDFGELMLRSYELLRDNEPVREHYRRRFRHILIDEFQDTNRLQYDWIKQLAGLPYQAADGLAGGAVMGPPRSPAAHGALPPEGAAPPWEQPGGGAVMAVGDDDQSIYAFRGARVGNMADFVREFRVAHQIKLEENYRSHSNILDSANALISHNERRLGKNLRTARGAGEPVRVREAPSDFAEAQWVVEEVEALTGKDDLRRSEIAVLYRSNAQSRALETALFNAGVPYRVYGGLRFFERAEIKHALAYLRLLENPHDDTSFLRVVNFPARGIGARSIEALQEAARAAGVSLTQAVALVPGKAGANLAAFVARIDVLREATQGRTLREIIEQMLDQSGLMEHYCSEKEGAERIENLEELASAAESFVTQEGFGRDAVALPVDETAGAEGGAAQDAESADTGETLSPLAAFLTHAALEAGEHQAQAGQDAVQLMTVHASKGLEFDAVFITGLEEGLFPHENALSNADGLEEERRLMYVAITRARKRLYLSHAQTRMLHGQTRYHVRSRFLEELPEEALKWITPKQGGFGAFAAASSAASRDPWAFDFERVTRRVEETPVPASREAGGIRTGQQVFHNKFGEGRVLAVEGTGQDARAQVSFARHGVKWLVVGVARLTVIE